MAIIDTGWKRLKADVMAVSRKSVDVGLLASKVSAHIVLIGFWNHYGTRRDGKRHVPAVPFISIAMRKRKATYTGTRGLLANSYRQMLKGQLNPNAFLKALGARAQSDITETIRTIKTPHNKPSTIAKKGFDDRLIGSKEPELVKSIRYEVR